MKSNSETALSILIDKYSNYVYTVAANILKNQYEAEDVVQEVFLKVWNYRDKLDEKTDILKLLFIITKRLSFNKLRLSHYKVKFVDVEGENDFYDIPPRDDYSLKEILRLEQRVVELLPEQQRRVYILSRQKGMSYEEISNALNISPNTVRNHIVQALKTLKFYFKKFGYLFFLFFFMEN